MSYAPRTDAAERAGSYRDMRWMETELAVCRKALEEIRDVPPVAFTRDQEEMANRTIARMIEISTAALAAIRYE